jgi:hypothetical protein
MFKGAKRDIIEIIAFICEGNKHLQDSMLDGGLELVFLQPERDDDNPCMLPMRWLIVVIQEPRKRCLDILMKNNRENQRKVRELERLTRRLDMEDLANGIERFQ